MPTLMKKIYKGSSHRSSQIVNSKTIEESADKSSESEESSDKSSSEESSDSEESNESSDSDESDESSDSEESDESSDSEESDGGSDKSSSEESSDSKKSDASSDSEESDESLDTSSSEESSDSEESDESSDKSSSDEASESKESFSDKSSLTTSEELDKSEEEEEKKHSKETPLFCTIKKNFIQWQNPLKNASMERKSDQKGKEPRSNLPFLILDKKKAVTNSSNKDRFQEASDAKITNNGDRKRSTVSPSENKKRPHDVFTNGKRYLDNKDTLSEKELSSKTFPKTKKKAKRKEERFNGTEIECVDSEATLSAGESVLYVVDSDTDDLVRKAVARNFAYRVRLDHNYCLPGEKKTNLKEDISNIHPGKKKPAKLRPGFSDHEYVKQIVKRKKPRHHSEHSYGETKNPSSFSRDAFPKKTEVEDMVILNDLIKYGLDKEDLIFLKKSYEALLQADIHDAWLDETHWVNHPASLPASACKKKEDNHTRIHITGSARCEGYYKLDVKEKESYSLRAMSNLDEIEQNANRTTALSSNRESRSNQKSLCSYKIVSKRRKISFGEGDSKNNHLKDTNRVKATAQQSYREARYPLARFPPNKKSFKGNKTLGKANTCCDQLNQKKGTNEAKTDALHFLKKVRFKQRRFTVKKKLSKRDVPLGKDGSNSNQHNQLKNTCKAKTTVHQSNRKIRSNKSCSPPNKESSHKTKTSCRKADTHNDCPKSNQLKGCKRPSRKAAINAVQKISTFSRKCKTKSSLQNSKIPSLRPVSMVDTEVLLSEDIPDFMFNPELASIVKKEPVDIQVPFLEAEYYVQSSPDSTSVDKSVDPFNTSSPAFSNVGGNCASEIGSLHAVSPRPISIVKTEPVETEDTPLLSPTDRNQLWSQSVAEDQKSPCRVSNCSSVPGLLTSVLKVEPEEPSLESLTSSLKARNPIPPLLIDISDEQSSEPSSFSSHSIINIDQPNSFSPWSQSVATGEKSPCEVSNCASIPHLSTSVVKIESEETSLESLTSSLKTRDNIPPLQILIPDERSSDPSSFSSQSIININQPHFSPSATPISNLKMKPLEKTVPETFSLLKTKDPSVVSPVHQNQTTSSSTNSLFPRDIYLHMECSEDDLNETQCKILSEAQTQYDSVRNYLKDLIPSYETMKKNTLLLSTDTS